MIKPGALTEGEELSAQGISIAVVGVFGFMRRLNGNGLGPGTWFLINRQIVCVFQLRGHFGTQKRGWKWLEGYGGKIRNKKLIDLRVGLGVVTTVF